MTEKTCHQCGAENPKQSKFCNRCGAPFFSDTTHICPECNQANPANLLYCDNCGTRLVDDSTAANDAVQGVEDDNASAGRSTPFSLPSRPPGQTGDLDVSADLPDWLRTGDFPDDDIQDEEDPPWLRSAQEDDEWSDDDAPTLEELSEDHTPKDDLPTWLLDEDAAQTIFSGEKSTDELFMSFVAGESGEEISSDKTREEQEPADAAQELQNWLSDMEAQGEVAADDEPAADANEKDELTEGDDRSVTSSPSEDEPLPAEMGEDDFLQWLSEIQHEESESAKQEEGVADALDPDDEAIAIVGQDVPGDVVADDATEVEREETGEELPDWLLDLSDEDDNLFSDVSPQESPSPDWLLDTTDTQDSAQSRSNQNMFAEEEPDSGEDIQFGGELDELFAESEQEDAAVSEVDASADKDEFLQWLDTLDHGQPAPEIEPASEAEDEGVESLSSEINMLEAISSDEDFELPDWLGTYPHEDETVDDEDGGHEALPDWLQDLAPDGGGISLPYVSGTAVEDNEDIERSAIEAEDAEGETQPVAAAGSDDELPDWIKAVSSELDEIASVPAPATEDASSEEIDEWGADLSELFATEGAAPALDTDAVNQEDLPAWFSDVLNDIEPADSDDEGLILPGQIDDIPEQLAGAEMPNWLDSPFVDETAAEPTPLEEIPEWLRTPLQERLARAAEERGLDQSALQGGDEWRELLNAPLSDDENLRLGAGDVVPAWLASIKSGETTGEDDEEADQDAGEKDSPIAGIPGALGIAPAVAQRSHRSRTVTEPGSKEHEQQVLLLHQLARMQQDETSVAMPRASQGSPLPLITRLALAVLLIAAIVGGLLLGGMAPNLAPSESGNLAPILEMVNHEPGHPALIVFDYTPALSGVFNPMAQQLFVELDNRDINTLFTSQSPSGLAMANRAAMDGGATDAIDLGFIPGDAAGLRRFGRCIQSSEPCGSLFGQRLDDVSVSQLREVRSIILITGERDSLLSWIEQLNVADTVSVGAIVTPALYPVALPYAASGQLVDVAIATGDMGADGAANTVALSLAQWLAGSAILVGAAYYLIIGIIRKRRA